MFIRSCINASTRAVVAIARIEAGQVKRVIDQVTERVFEGAGQQLPFKIDGKETGAGIYMLVARHWQLSGNRRFFDP